ncbi:MAG: hypothetical protein IPM64_06030 [Phycisphaerales bacterium]|nr:hypothetical protein [Phycisphaerales bacterium]
MHFARVCAVGAAGAAIARTLTWNAENRLIDVRPAVAEAYLPTNGSAVRVAFGYDYLGRRIEKIVYTWQSGSPNAWVEVSRTRFVYDGWLLLEELDVDSEGDVVGVRRQYTWGLDLSGQSGDSTVGGLHGAGGYSPAGGLHGAGRYSPPPSPVGGGTTDCRLAFASAGYTGMFAIPAACVQTQCGTTCCGQYAGPLTAHIGGLRAKSNYFE